jgi:hypothetical protein
VVSEAGIHIANPMVLANLGRLGSMPVKCDQLDQYSDHFALLRQKTKAKMEIFISKNEDTLKKMIQSGDKIIPVERLVKQIEKLQRSQDPKDREKLKQVCDGTIQLIKDAQSKKQAAPTSPQTNGSSDET